MTLVSNTKATKATKSTKAKAPKAVAAPRKYKNLTATFFRGSPLGQLISIYKTRETNPDKWDDYRAALQAGDCTFPEPITESIAAKMKELGLEV
jgi:hypothetical protein